MEPIGQFDDYDPQILCHSQKHFPQAVGLLFLMALKGNSRELRHPINQQHDLFTELLSHLLPGDIGILQNIVEEARGDGDRVIFKFGQNHGYLIGMPKVDISRVPVLVPMGFLSHGICPLYDLQVCMGTVLAYTVFQFLNTHGNPTHRKPLHRLQKAAG